jgi:hypothetical protein
MSRPTGLFGVCSRRAIAIRFRFNTINWANPGASVAASTSFGIITNTRNANNAPGIGAGEPRNVQLALKIIF